MSSRALPLLVLLAVLAGVSYLIFSETEPAPPPDEPGVEEVEPGNGPEGPIETAPAPGDNGGRTVLDGAEGPDEDLAFVRGRVTGPGGSRIAGARVRLVASGGFLAMGMSREALAEGMVDCRADGSFSLPWPADGQAMAVAALAPGFGAQRVNITNPADRIELSLDPAVTVEGRVIDGDGQPVGDAVLHLSAKQMIQDGLPEPLETGRDGRFSFDAPAAGSYQLRVRSAAGADAVLDPLEVAAGMEPLTIQVRGTGGLIVRVFETDGAPVEGARVAIRFSSSQGNRFGPKQTRSGADGVARFYAVDRGSWLLSVSAPGFAKVQRRHLQQNEGPVEVAVEMAAPGAIEAVVVDRDGVAAADFEVQLHSPKAALRMQVASLAARTDEEGRVRWEGLHYGPYRLIGGGIGWQMELEGVIGAEGEGGQPKEGFGASVANVEVLPGETAITELRLEGHARVRAEVVGARGPVAEAEVRLHQRGVSKGHPSSMAVTGADGVALMPPVRPGHYQVSVRAMDGKLELPVKDGLTVDEPREELRIELPMGAVAGRLRTSSGPVAGARVEIAGSGVIGSWAETGPDGSFLLQYLPQGEYRLRSEVEGYLPWTSAPFGSDGRSQVELGEGVLYREATIQGRAFGLPPDQAGGFALRVAELRDSTGNRVGVAALEAGDRFHFEGLQPGSYQLILTAGGVIGQPIPLQLKEGENPVEVR